MTHPENDTLLSKDFFFSFPQMSLCVKSNFYFPLIQTAVWQITQVHFRHHWTVYQTEQTWPSKFTRIHYGHYKCFTDRHLLVSHIFNRSCRWSPELPAPWVKPCSGQIKSTEAEKGLPSDIHERGVVSKKSLTSVHLKITARCHGWSHLC